LKWAETRRVSVPKNHLAITATGDWHCGAKASRDDIIAPCVEQIADEPDRFGLATGDLYEAICGDDKRMDPTTIDRRAPPGQVISWQVEHAKQYLMKARGKWLGMVIGNHEREYLKRAGLFGLYYQQAEEVGAPPLEYCSRFRLDVWFDDPKGLKRGKPHRTLDCTAHHGFGMAATRSGKKLALERLMNGPIGRDSDIVFMAHLHGLDAIIALSKRPNASYSGSVLWRRLGVLCGCALDTYDDFSTTYGEIKGYGDYTLGFPTVHIYRDDPFPRVEM
jgi:hypothetical protein